MIIDKFKAEENIILRTINEDVIDCFKNNNVFVAGGAITSVFTNREINDLDIYFRNEKDLVFTLHELLEGEFEFRLVMTCMTDRSILFIDNDTQQKIQFITFKYFETPIFKQFRPLKYHANG